MSSFNDFCIGFFKPVRDLLGSIPIYVIFTSGKTLKSTLINSNFSFNIWLFLVSYIGVSSLLELIADANYNLRRGYKDPIDSSIRMFGLLLGTGVFSFLLLPVYNYMGGNVSDVFIAAIIAALFSLGGTSLRLFYRNKRQYSY